MANRSGFAPGDTRENWAILRALSQKMDVTLNFDTLGQLREALFIEHPHLKILIFHWKMNGVMKWWGN